MLSRCQVVITTIFTLMISLSSVACRPVRRDVSVIYNILTSTPEILKKYSHLRIHRLGKILTNDCGEDMPDTLILLPINLKLLTSRRKLQKPNVEVGPGAFKSEIISYPKDQLSKDLKKLLALKSAMEERNKDLNEDKENSKE